MLSLKLCYCDFITFFLVIPAECHQKLESQMIKKYIISTDVPNIIKDAIFISTKFLSTSQKIVLIQTAGRKYPIDYIFPHKTTVIYFFVMHKLMMRMKTNFYMA